MPRGWAIARLGDMAAINPSRPDIIPSDEQLVTFLPMAAVEPMSNLVDLSAQRVWSDVRKGYVRFQDGDVLFAKITPCMENGKVAHVRGLAG